MVEEIKVSAMIPATARRIYDAWLDSEEHGAFTGGEAVIEQGLGGKFTAWDGYISGKTLELVPHKKIVQMWRTTEFPEGSESSIVEVHLNEMDGATEVTIVHTNIPDGQAATYEQGWVDYYFAPMIEYFGGEDSGEVGV